MKTNLPQRAHSGAFPRLLASAVLAAAVLSACGGDSVNTTAEPDASESTTTAMSETAMSDTEMSDTAMSDTEMSGDGAGHDHHDELAEVGWTPVPAVDLAVTADGDGWIGSLDVTNFAITEDEVDPEPIDGQGHAHLYIDGVKDRRLYDTSFTIDELDPGSHELRVELVGNDHKALAVGGQPIGASTTVDVEGEPVSKDADGEIDADIVIDVSVVDGSVEVTTEGQGDSKEVPVKLGSSVAIVVTSDIAEEVHVHGYDVFADLVPGEQSVIEFNANIPGGFEVELEGRGQLLVDLVVS